VPEKQNKYLNILQNIYKALLELGYDFKEFRSYIKTLFPFKKELFQVFIAEIRVFPNSPVCHLIL
jgi:hypothetical protein